MEYIKFSNSDFKVSKIGIGTWKLGSDPSTEIKTIKYALDNGVNFIDTAEMYGTELLVSKAITGYDRSNLFIATKVSPHNFKYNDIIKACDNSLKKLNLKYIDLYQLHFPNYAIPMEETFSALEYLIDDGKIMNIGVSNFNLKELKKASSILKKYKIKSNQIEYSILVRDLYDEIINYCNINRIEIIAYSPLIRGNIFKKRSEELEGVFAELRDKYNITDAQIALNWLVSKNVIPIPKSGSLNHMKENIESINIKIGSDDIKRIDSIKLRKSGMIKPVQHIIKRTTFWSKLVGSQNEKNVKKL